MSLKVETLVRRYPSLRVHAYASPARNIYTKAEENSRVKQPKSEGVPGDLCIILAKSVWDELLTSSTSPWVSLCPRKDYCNCIPKVQKHIVISFIQLQHSMTQGQYVTAYSLDFSNIALILFTLIRRHQSYQRSVLL